MKRNGKRSLRMGILLLVLFGVWTVLVRTADVRRAGETGMPVGFASLNIWFHELAGVHMWVYTVTDWLGLVPVCVCMLFAMIGLWQMLRRRGLLRVDRDILFLGAYFAFVTALYLLFEMFPVNYRPVFIEGRIEASYPSSTTLLVLCVMPTLVFQAERRMKRQAVRMAVRTMTVIFSMFMVVGRAVSGVHWITDIVGSLLLSAGLFCVYRASVLIFCGKKNRREVF